MKRFIRFFSIVLITVWIISAFAFINQKNEVPEKHLEIVLRDIGHQLLLQAKDSTSAVLPIKKINEHIYQISFQNRFGFIHDTLVDLVQRQFEKYQLPKEYIVSVKDCQQKQTMFAYEIGDKTNTLVPCTGREQVVGCYLIEIEFSAKSPLNLSLLLVLLIPLVFVGLYLKDKWKKKPVIVLTADTPTRMSIGKFQFSAEENVLWLDNNPIPLSKNETKALKIFSQNIDYVIEREKLMKEIWEDDGIVVISRNVDVLVSKLRKKLIQDDRLKIVNIHGRGYKFTIV